MPPSDPRTDRELVAALNAGDAAAFDALYYRHRDWVVRLAVRFTGNEADALDVMQQTFAYLAGKFPGFALSAGLTTFLYPAVRNLSLAARRSRLRLSSAAGGGAVLDELPAPPAPPPEDPRAGLAAVLARLPAGQREVVLMRFVDDLSLEEISAALGLPLGTIKSRLHNAIGSLRGDPRVAQYFDRA